MFLRYPQMPAINSGQFHRAPTLSESGICGTSSRANEHRGSLLWYDASNLTTPPEKPRVNHNAESVVEAGWTAI